MQNFARRRAVPAAAALSLGAAAAAGPKSPDVVLTTDVDVIVPRDRGVVRLTSDPGGRGG